MKSNLTPHLCWTIGLLLSVVCFLVLGVTDGTKVNAFISFAASLASLILAVVAIFYSIVSTQAQSGLLHNVDRAAQDYAKSSDDIRIASASLRDLAESIDEKLQDIPNEIRGVNSTISERFEQFTRQSTTDTPGVDDSVENADAVNAGVAVCLHIICKSFDMGVAFDTRIFKDSDSFFSGMIFGFCHCIRALNTYGIKLDVAGGVVNVRSVGSLNSAHWINLSFANAGKETIQPLVEFYESKGIDLPKNIPKTPVENEVPE